MGLYKNWLVVTGSWLLFSHILGMSSSQLTTPYFSEGWLNHHNSESLNTQDFNSRQLYNGYYTLYDSFRTIIVILVNTIVIVSDLVIVSRICWSLDLTTAFRLPWPCILSIRLHGMLRARICKVDDWVTIHKHNSCRNIKEWDPVDPRFN